ncbi:redoxin domain-containing protein [Ammoniphilus resinae]|uniref:Thiol-disulfide isomerase/thioredoxin n=1 Tax=Ammoniphilus resinae TaxID=861532 RepID=A0ABS4GPF6_9BACL|nr:redoxin domain-containing protein [Ammoniphilus resinae]MBP1932153.1 thiol-disulfide isomerase/thioredoxin [Ammoniphilus resinae]
MIPMRLRTPMPPMEGATKWLNEGGFQAKDLQGKPVLVHFWAVSCQICHEVMEEVVSYRKKYGSQRLQIVGVHMPKRAADIDVDKVKQDVAQYHIEHPVAIDNHHKIREAFQNEFVPAFYLFDQEGKLSFRAAGNKGFANLEPKIEQLLQ